MKEKRREVGNKLLVPTRWGATYLRKRRVVPLVRLAVCILQPFMVFSYLITHKRFSSNDSEILLAPSPIKH